MLALALTRCRHEFLCLPSPVVLHVLRQQTMTRTTWAREACFVLRECCRLEQGAAWDSLVWVDDNSAASADSSHKSSDDAAIAFNVSH